MKDVAIVIALLFAGFAVAYWGFPRQTTKIVEKPIVIDLTARQMDSLRLAFREQFKGSVRTKVVHVEDSARVAVLRATIDSLKEVLGSEPGSDYTLEYHTDSLGAYRDTLDVVASFVTDTISVHFAPQERKWETTRVDTIAVPATRGLTEFDLKDVVEIVGTAVLVGVLLK